MLSQFNKIMPRKMKHWMKYSLPFIGDLNNSLLMVIFILYGVAKNLSPGQIGWIGTSYGLSYLISSPLIGSLGDKLSRKTSLIVATIGQSSISLMYIIIMLVNIEGHLYLYLIIFGQIIRAFFYAFFWPTLEAYLSELGGNSLKSHQRNIRNFCIAWSFGAAVGSNLGGIFADFSNIWGVIIVFVLYLFAIFVVFFSIKPNSSYRNSIDPTPQNSESIRFEDHTSNSKQNNKKKEKSKEKSKEISNKFLKITLILFIGTLVYSIYSNGIINYFPNYAKLPEGLSLTGTLIGQIIFFFGIGRFLAFLLGDFLPITIPFLLGSLFLLGGLIPLLAFVSETLILMTLMLISGFLAGRIYYISLELTLKLQNEGKGAKAGIFESIVGLGSSLIPILSGILAERGLSLPFLIVGIFSLILAILCLTLALSNKKKM